MKALLLTCGLIVTIVSFVSMLYDFISSDYDKKYPDKILNILLGIMTVTGVILIVSSSDGRFTGVHDTRSDVYIITKIEEEYVDEQFIAKYKARSYNTEHRLNQTGVVIQFYDALEKFHVGDTLKLEK